MTVYHTASSSSSSSAAVQKPNPRPAPATPSSGPPSNKPAPSKIQRPPSKQGANPPPPRYPVDSKQQITITPPGIYNPRPHKKNPSTGAPADNFYPRPTSSSGRLGEQQRPSVGSTPNQYLRPAGPMPGGWPGTSPSPTPPPPGAGGSSNVPAVENGDHNKHHGNVIAHGASTMVQGFLGLISTGKSK